MNKQEFNKLNIALDQNHLLDIYENVLKYLELGTMQIANLKRLLDYEELLIEDISYLDIQNLNQIDGKVKDEELATLLPYFFFQNINNKHRPNQVFITHGLIRYLDDNKECFAPLILIPINIYWEDNKFIFQKIGNVIENKRFLEYIEKKLNISIPIIDRLDTMTNIDNFISTFIRYTELDFSYENYLGYAEISTTEVIIDQSKFSVSKIYDDYLYEDLYDKNNFAYYSKKYNRNQRYALNQAIDGKSFVLSGNLGTGKTTVLKDIALNAVSEGLRVLYVSNMKETLNSVEAFIIDKKLGHYAVNLATTFSKIHKGAEIITRYDEAEDIDYDRLLDSYKYIADYQHAMTGRILDFRFIDIVNELSLLEKENPKKLAIDYLEDIYKFEYLEILEAVTNIEGMLKKMNRFEDSPWKEIPIINDIKYPNQVISLIHSIHNDFSLLQKQKMNLEYKFGFKEIGNYAYLKNVIHNFRGLKHTDVPRSWHDEDNYKEAKAEYQVLKTLIFNLQELEYDLDSRYKGLENYSIKAELKNLYGDFFTKLDLEKINKIIDNRINLTVTINKAIAQNDIFNKSINKFRRMISYDFSLANDILFVIIQLADIFVNTDVNHKFIKSVLNEEYNEVIHKAEDALAKYNEYVSEKDKLFEGISFLDFGTIEENVQIFNDYNAGNATPPQKRIINKLKRDYKAGFFKYSQAVDRYNVLMGLIKIEEDIFIDLFDYLPEQKYLDDFTKLNDFVDGIKNFNLRNKITKSLRRVANYSVSQVKNLKRTAELLYSSFLKINDNYLELIEYGFLEEKQEFEARIADLLLIEEYIQKLFASNELLFSMKKVSTNVYIKADDYCYIDETYSKIEEFKKELRSNKQYPKLYGELYEYDNTDLVKISKIIHQYRLYSELFVDYSYVIKSLDKAAQENLDAILELCSEAVESSTEVFKTYFKIFKSSMSKFYYAPFIELIEHLDELIDNKESLITYLRVTENLQVIAKYEMYKFIEYIVLLEDASNLVNDFKFTYNSVVYNKYIGMYPELKEYEKLENLINETIGLEDKVIDIVEVRTFNKIKRRSTPRYSVYGIKHLDYKGLIKRTHNTKHLVLTTTQILNRYLKIDDFDLILIDDGHLFGIGEYAYALTGKQVIISGELQYLEAAMNNLIARLSNTRNIKLNYRYDVMPKSLNYYAMHTQAPIYKDYKKNFGFKVIGEKIYKFITDRIVDDKDVKLNLFIGSLDKQRTAINQLAIELSKKGLSNEEIITHLYRINITDLALGYLINADCNILFLEDYYKYETEYLVANMIDNLLMSKERLVIYDTKYLESNNESFFLRELRRIRNDKNVFALTNLDSSVNKLIKELEARKFVCYSDEYGSFTIKHQNNLFGVTLYWDSKKTNYDVLNEFRDLHLGKSEIVKKNILIWSMELLNDFNGVIEKIIKEVKNG